MTDTTRQTVSQLLTAFSGQQNTLTIPRPYIALCDGDILTALLLSQCVYWTDRTKDAQGWFAKSYQEWLSELGMTQYQVNRAAKLLKRLGLETKLRKFNGAPTVHYRINMDVFSQCIMKFLDNPGLSSFSIIHDEETSQSLTEPTTKTTTKPTLQTRASKSENATPSKKVQPNPSAKTKTPPSSAPPPKDYDDVSKTDRLDIIRAWATSLSIEPANAYSKEANHRSAAEIFRAGYRAPQVTLFVKAKMQDSWWRGKTLTLDKVAELMPAYLQSLKPKQTISFEEHKPLYPPRERLSPEDIARRLAMKEQILAGGS